MIMIKRRGRRKREVYNDDNSDGNVKMLIMVMLFFNIDSALDCPDYDNY